jgi:glycine/D-amino acid oxidase-like deaminating enzyme
VTLQGLSPSSYVETFESVESLAMIIEVETLDELRKVLREMKPGTAGGLHYDSYATGEPDELARELANQLAQETGCEIEFRPDEQAVWFVKKIDPADLVET